MNQPNPNHKSRPEIEDVLRGARFEMRAAFDDSLRQRLQAAIPPAPARKAPSPMRRLFIPRSAAPDYEEMPMNKSRIIGAFSFGVVVLMAALFIGLVLMRPSGAAVGPTEEPEGVELLHMQFDQQFELYGYEVRQTERSFSVELMWRPLVTPSKDYMIYLHAARGGDVIAQVDSLLVGDDLVSSLSTDVDLPTTRWQTNHLLRSWYTLTIPPDQPVPDVVYIGVYDPDTGEELHLWKDGISLSTVRVQLWSSDDPVAAELDYGECGPENPCLSPDGKYWLHRFSDGETLEALALAYQSDLGCILRENGLAPDGYQILVGTLLKICVPPQPQPEAVGGENPIVLGNGWNSLAMSGDGMWIAAETRPAPGEWPTVYLQHTVTGEMIFIAYGSSPSLSADGRYVAFVTHPKGGDAASWNRMGVVNVYDRVESSYAEVAFGGGGIGSAATPAISGDGRYVAYTGHGSEGGPPQIYVADRETGAVTGLLYPDSQPGDTYNSNPSISADGRYVVFAANPISNPGSHIVLYDQVEQTTQVLGEGFFPRVSADGSTVTYLYNGAVEGQGEGWINAAALDVATGEIRWLGRAIDAGPDGMWNDPGSSPSADGRRIAFWSVLEDPRNPEIAPPTASGGLGSAYAQQYLFVYDALAGEAERGDSAEDHPSLSGSSASPALSSDGSRVAYLWADRDLPAFGLYLRDLDQDRTYPLYVSQ